MMLLQTSSSGCQKTHLKDVSLVVGGHGGACDADDEGRKRIEAGTVAGGLFDPLREASGS